MKAGAEVLLARTGTANVASVCAALERAGCRPLISEDPARVLAAERVVLPGVGAFGPAMAALAERGLDGALRERVAAGRPTLAICLGLQLLFEGSAESPDAPGLGLAAGRARAFEGQLRVPHLGWNRVQAPGAELLAPGHAYFAHTYYLERAPKGWTTAWCDYGVRFVAALERGAVLACQFHPELSGAFGRDLLGRWLERSAAAC